jgi:hypothetical protein
MHHARLPIPPSNARNYFHAACITCEKAGIDRPRCHLYLAFVLWRLTLCFVTTTLTFRLESEKRKKLRKKAALLGKSESEFLREMLDRELEDRPLSAAIGHLKGTLSFDVKSHDSLRQALRDRNWRS